MGLNFRLDLHCDPDQFHSDAFLRSDQFFPDENAYARTAYPADRTDHRRCGNADDDHGDQEGIRHGSLSIPEIISYTFFLRIRQEDRILQKELSPLQHP